MKETKKERKLGMAGVIALIVIIVSGLFVLFIDVFAAEGLFGLGGEDWSAWNSRRYARIWGITSAAILYLVPGFRDWIKEARSEEEGQE